MHIDAKRFAASRLSGNLLCSLPIGRFLTKPHAQGPQLLACVCLCREIHIGKYKIDHRYSLRSGRAIYRLWSKEKALKLKILHVCQTDSEGGAAIAARRLHTALVDAGHDSHMMVIRKLGDDTRVREPLGQAGRIQVRIARALTRRAASTAAAFDPTGMRSIGWMPTGLGREINNFGADIVHIHWIGGESMSLGEVARIRAPIVWTLHDMWAFSGAHHWGTAAEKYFEATGSRVARLFDQESWMRKRKSRHWRGLNIHFICPSDWMAKQFKQSAIFGGSDHSVVPNTLSTDHFTAEHRVTAKEKLGLPSGAVVLFGAVGGAKDPTKGGDFLAATLAAVQDLGLDPTVAVFGGSAPGDLTLDTRELGILKGDETLANVYRAADIFICPSRIECFPNTIVEAQCCGTPAVGFSSSGQTDAIGDMTRLAKPFECGELAQIIARLLRDPPAPEQIRKDMLGRVARSIVVAQHLDVYRSHQAMSQHA